MPENKKTKLVLGTVQLGLDYGINNKRGKPSRKDALGILDYAFEHGIRIFDTAYAYGDAEDILGEFIKSRDIASEVSVISKLKPHSIPQDSSDVFKIIEEEIKKSLVRLGRGYLDGYLLHTPEYIYNSDIVQALASCKERGLVRNIGVSPYEETDALYAANSGLVDYIQIPYSVFDQRLNTTDFFKAAKENSVTVFARSAFLQGLIFMEGTEIPDYISEAKHYLHEFDQIIRKHGLTRAQAALLFSYNHAGIDYVVFGVDTQKQLEEDIQIIESEVDCAECLEELRDKFLDIKKSIILPSLWKNPRA